MNMDLLERLRRPVVEAGRETPQGVVEILLSTMREAADLVERQGAALDSAMMVVWWVVGEGLSPAGYEIDPDQVMVDNVEEITRDDGSYWEQMFQALSGQFLIE